MRTDEVGGVVAVAEPSGGLAGARQIDAVVGLVGPGDAFSRQVVVVADVQRRVPEHVHRWHLPEPHHLLARLYAGDGDAEHDANNKSLLHGKLVPHAHGR